MNEPSDPNNNLTVASKLINEVLKNLEPSWFTILISVSMLVRAVSNTSSAVYEPLISIIALTADTKALASARIVSLQIVTASSILRVLLSTVTLLIISIRALQISLHALKIEVLLAAVSGTIPR